MTDKKDVFRDKERSIFWEYCKDHIFFLCFIFAVLVLYVVSFFTVFKNSNPLATTLMIVIFALLVLIYVGYFVAAKYVFIMYKELKSGRILTKSIKLLRRERNKDDEFSNRRGRVMGNFKYFIVADDGEKYKVVEPRGHGSILHCEDISEVCFRITYLEKSRLLLRIVPEYPANMPFKRKVAARKALNALSFYIY